MSFDIKKKEIQFFIIILVIAGIFCIIFSMMHTQYNMVTVSINGTTEKQFDLSQDQNYTIQTEKGYNILQIQNHIATIIEADCPDQLCVQQKSISHTGEMIVCLPHKVVVEIR